MKPAERRELPIGVFDSGVGGLTVVKALQSELPGEDIVYLGDTARLPYGTKSPASIARYAAQATAALASRSIKLLVVACNTASAVALPALKKQMRPVPVMGVVEPGANAAVRTGAGGSHLVLATEATVRLHAYRDAIAARDASASVHEHACEVLVALAEEGWTGDDVAIASANRYLRDACANGFNPDTIILGCTHFPLLKATIAAATGGAVTVVDSATTTAAGVRAMLETEGLLRDAATAGSLRLLATDGVQRFARVGGLFLGTPLTADDVQLIDL